MLTEVKQIPFGKPMIDDAEKNAVQDVLNGTQYVHGPQTVAFEQSFAEYTKSPHALSVSSCTAGLHLAYFYLGLKPGDEVIVPAQTHTATVHAVEFMGGKPIFVDAELQTGNIDIDQIEAKITEQTKAISVVHFLGMPVNMERIVAIAKKHNLFVVEDCALAIGATFKNKHVGLWGNLGCFSFYPVKQMTTIEGGMVITEHEEIASKLERQRAFGVDRHVGERKIPGLYDVTMLGFNYRMNEIEAAIGVQQVKKMDGFQKARKENYDALTIGLQEIEEVSLFESTGGDFQSSYYCHSMLLNDALIDKRIELKNKLKELGVGTSIYYPQAVPDFTYYREKYGEQGQECPNARRISASVISLPVGPHLTPDDMNIITTAVKQAIKEVL